MHAFDPVKESDWYAVLGLGPQASAEEIGTVVERLSRQASALANTAPHRSQELREITRAIKRDLLSGTESRQRYDRSRPGSGVPAGPAGPAPARPTAPPPPAAFPAPAACRPPAAGPPPPGGGPPPAVPPAPSAGLPPVAGVAPGAGFGARLKKFMQTSWTCPACGEGAMPSDRFCKACGTAITPPVSRREAAFCGSCGTPFGGQENFCARCGTRREQHVEGGRSGLQ
jgi:hypothetical protein